MTRPTLAELLLIVCVVLLVLIMCGVGVTAGKTW